MGITYEKIKRWEKWKKIKKLILALQSTEENIRWNAVEALGNIGDSKACEALVNVLKTDSDYRVKSNTIEALGKIKCQDISDDLLKCLDNETDEFIYQDIIKVLGNYTSEKVFNRITKVYLDKSLHQNIIYSAGDSLKRIDETKAAELFISLLDSEDTFLKEKSLSFLEKINTTEAQNAVSKVHFNDITRNMTENEMIEKLSELINAYHDTNTVIIEELEPICKNIGKELNRRGGIDSMRNVFYKLPQVAGLSTLEMLWGGIGTWSS